VTQFVGVMTIVLVRKSLREAVSQVQTSERGIGLLGFGVSGIDSVHVYGPRLTGVGQQGSP
jgi:hypothetical protein